MSNKTTIKPPSDTRDPGNFDTSQNVLTAFNEESFDRVRSALLAELAIQAKKPRLAKLLRGMDHSSEIHARGLDVSMSGFKSAEQRLEEAIIYEDDLIQTYQRFLIKAKSENENEAHKAFEQICIVKEKNKEKMEEVLKVLQQGGDVTNENKLVFICPICGIIELAGDQTECSNCKTSAELFVVVE